MDFKRLDKIYNELKKAYEETEQTIMQGNTGKIGIFDEAHKAFNIVIQIKSFNDEAGYLMTELQQLKNNNLTTVTDTNTGTVQ